MTHPVQTLGAVELVDFPRFLLKAVPARIDTGAKTSSIWASNISESNGVLTYALFDTGNTHFTGHILTTTDYILKMVASSNGVPEARYVVRLVVRIGGRTIRAKFTLANRSAQAYPVLIGRNVLRGKFVVDVRQGQRQIAAERQRREALRALRLHTKESS